ncbi:hypothetical protein [Archangium sp.]|uniref:hypothetical protein n=1 Tax=Archangium sp. TaxID=1872627 RepID=UPI002D46A308|nr:hypothetical protein [Archangium sp.]HYO56807.1 hypothetical protein [Archangium sp.]
MTHLSPEELVKKFEEARKAGEHERGNPEQLRLHRELAEECPAFTPNLLYLARLQQVIDQPSRSTEEVFSEIQRILELAVLGSDRSAPVLLELGNFLDTFHNGTPEAMKLYNEGEQKALATLEEAWFFKIRYLFPEPNIFLDDEIQTTKRYAAQEGLAPPEGS